MRPIIVSLVTICLVSATGCADHEVTSPSEMPLEAQRGVPGASQAVLDPVGVAAGREIFRFDDFGSWRFWTDTARLNVLVEGVSPTLALTLGLKVDSEAVPPDVLQAVLTTPALLADPATTRALLALDAVVGLRAQVDGDEITRIGITCALCHATVDNSVAAGIGRRLDGWPAGDLAVGTILSLLPGLPEIASSLGVSTQTLADEYTSWPPGFFDPRVNLDGRFDAPPVLIPPAYGLHGVGLETYTAEGPISYWNSYVAVTQMHGHGSFSDPRLGVRITVPAQEDEVRSKLPFLRLYQLSLAAPVPDPASFDPAAAARGRAVFTGPGDCASCHTGPLFTSGRLHDPAVTGTEPTWAERSTTGAYRTTPLRALQLHAPYFHDGSAATLEAVVEHYVAVRGLDLTTLEKQDLVEYLKSL